MCASSTTLERMLAGELPAAEVDELRAHLAQCPRCQETLSRLSDHQPLRLWAEVGRQVPPLAITPDLGRLLVGLRPRGSLETTERCEDESAVATQSQKGALPPRVGEQIGPYRILGELGRGGMGIVFKAFDPQLERTVALKVVRSERCDQQSRERFVREARAVAGIVHDHVVAVHAVVNPECGPAYLVMQFVAGPTLREQIDGEKRLEPREAARITSQVADGLAAAHAAGLVHRDIKPSNIILDPAQDRAKIMDFGLVRSLDGSAGMTQEGLIAGTPEYMSPEQIRAPERADARTDVYGLGVTLYEMLTGEPPFRGTPQMVLDQVLRDEPAALRRLNDRVPRDLETICLKALAKEPERRYQAATEMRDDLRRWLDGEPIRARPVSSLERGWRWCRRRPREASLIAAVALLTVAITAVTSLSAWRLRVEKNVAVENLRESYLSQAQARRWSGQAGRRFTSLEVLTKAAKIRPGLDLRNEAIACMPLVDLRVVRQWNWSSQPHAFDLDLAHYARTDVARQLVSVHRGSGDTELFVVPGFGSGSNSPSFSPDGRWLAVGHDAHGVQIWEVGAGKPVLKLAPAGSEKSIQVNAFSPDSRRFAVHLGDRVLRICELPSGRELQRVEVGARPASANFHPTEDKFAFHDWSGTAVRIVDTNSGQVVTTLPQQATINSFSWRPDGRYLAVACADGAIRVWDAKSEKLHKVLEGHPWAGGCVFNHAGDLLATSGWDVTTRLWDPVTGTLLVSMPGYGQHFSRDDSRLAYSFADVRPEVGIWEVAAGNECRTLRAEDEQGTGPGDVSIHLLGRLMATASDDGVRLWDLAVAKEIAHLPLGWCRAARFHPIGDSLITSSGRGGIQRWPLGANSETGKLQLGPPQTLYPTPNTHHNRVSQSRDGKWLAAVIDYQQAVVIDLENPAHTTRLGPHVDLDKVAISPDGQWVATGTQHGSGIKVWNARSGQLEKEIAGSNLGWGIFMSEGQMLVTGSAGTAQQTWKVGSWNELPSQHGCGEGVLCADGKLFAAFTSGQPMIQLFDPASGSELATLTAPNPVPIAALCFSPDGSKLAAACMNLHAVQLWDLRAIRARLKSMDLDWPAPEYSPATSPTQLAPLQVNVLREEQ